MALTRRLQIRLPEAWVPAIREYADKNLPAKTGPGRKELTADFIRLAIRNEAARRNITLEGSEK